MKWSTLRRAFAGVLALASVGTSQLVAAERDEPTVVSSTTAELYYGPSEETYDSSSKETCGCSICPTWTARVGYVHMWRHGTGDVGIVEPDVGFIPRFTSSEFDFDGRSGLDVSVSRENGCGFAIDFRYLWVDNFGAAENFFPLDDPQINTTPRTPTLFDTGDRFAMDSTSEIQSFEILARRSWRRFNVSAGFRYIQLDESLGINIFEIPGGIFADEYGFAASNNLYGFQMGIDGVLYDNCRRFRVDGFTKLGLYGNSASASAFLDDPGDPFLSGSGTDNGGGVAFGLELGIFATYDITCNLSIRGGYQMLYLDGVALAADQVPNTGNLIGLPGTVPVNADTANSVLYHGLNIGLEYRF